MKPRESRSSGAVSVVCRKTSHSASRPGVFDVTGSLASSSTLPISKGMPQETERPRGAREAAFAMASETAGAASDSATAFPSSGTGWKRAEAGPS